MTRLTRWEPFRDVRRMHDMLDRIMDQAVLDWSPEGVPYQGIIPIDVYQTDNDIVITATAPGIKPDDLDISVTADSVTIHGEVGEEHEEEGRRYHVRERRYGSFARSIALPTTIDADKTQAEFENGILTLTLPKVEEVKPKSIKVKAK
jgi:HSP20 family protein